MKKIEHKGNLPKHLRMFAKQLGGVYDSVAGTEFYECTNISEFESAAAGKLKENVSFEIAPPTVDTSTGRGFLVGFEVSDPQHVDTLHDYVQLKIYYVEASETDVTSWTERIQRDRSAFERDMRERRKRAQAYRNILRVAGGSDD